MKSIAALCALSAIALWYLPMPAPLAGQNAAAKPPLYNTVIQKLREGKQVFSYTQTKFDIPGNCEAAKHYDYTWYEMQHSTLELRMSRP